ncbi:MAG: hemerythrin domain-containing protein [Pseudomonadota bacterium]|nr:hemerythrin domain-containing protein [Pseudomonadota bacterium]
MSNPMVDLHTDHRHFAKVLNILRQELDLIQQDGDPFLELIVEALEYLRSYADEYHHPREEVIFTYHLDRSDELAEVIGRLSGQHAEIKQLTTDLLEHSEGLLHDEVLTREAYSSALENFLIKQIGHLRDEEEAVFPMLEKTFTPEDWRLIDRRMPPRPDVLFCGEEKARFKALYERIMADGTLIERTD